MRLPIGAPIPVIEEGAIIRRESSRIVLPPAGTSRLVPLRPKAAEKPAADASKQSKNGEPGDPADKAPTGDPALDKNKDEKKPDGLELNKPADDQDGEPAPAEKKDGKMA